MNAAFIVLLAIFIAGAMSLSCYQCTANDSESCSSSDLAELAPFKKTCSALSDGPLKGTQAIGCRKTLQTVDGEQLIIRECAYSGTVVDGQKKTGNFGIQLYYYQCVNQKDDEPCNSAYTHLTAVTILISLLASLF